MLQVRFVTSTIITSKSITSNFFTSTVVTQMSYSRLQTCCALSVAKSWNFCAKWVEEFVGWVVFQNISIIWNFNRKILGFLKLLLLKASFTTNFEIAWLFDRKCTRKVFWHFIEDRIILRCFKTRCIKRVVPSSNWKSS